MVTRKRILKAKLRATRVNRVRKTDGRTAKLYTTGVAFQQLYGAEATGISAHNLAKMRQHMNLCAGGLTTGACFRTSAAWAYGSAADPLVVTYTSQIKIWIQL